MSDTTVEVGDSTVDGEDLLEAIDEVLVSNSGHYSRYKTDGNSTVVGDVAVSCDGCGDDPDGYVTSFVTGETTFTDLEDLRERVEDEIVDVFYENELFVEFLSNTGEYGCVLPLNADFEVSEKNAHYHGAHTIFFDDEDDVSDLDDWEANAGSRPDSEHSRGVHVVEYDLIDAEEARRRYDE